MKKLLVVLFLFSSYLSYGQLPQSKLTIDNTDNGIKMDVFVLKLNGQYVDVSPMEGKLHYDRYTFCVDGKVKKMCMVYQTVLNVKMNLLTQTQALELISNYGFSLREGVLRKSFIYHYGENVFKDSKLPSYLTVSLESIYLK